MVRSELGYIAHVPGKARPKDVIALLEGNTMPFILRPRRDLIWKLVGEAYMHGIMRGKVWNEEGCEEIRLVWVK